MSKIKHKIAIMTQSLGFNYGGIIQNYALQKVLSNLGYSIITVDRDEENPHSKLKILASRYKSLFNRYILNKSIPTYLDYRKISSHNRNFLKKKYKIIF